LKQVKGRSLRLELLNKELPELLSLLDDLELSLDSLSNLI
jgi:hypothetical protein